MASATFSVDGIHFNAAISYADEIAAIKSAFCDREFGQPRVGVRSDVHCLRECLDAGARVLQLDFDVPTVDCRATDHDAVRVGRGRGPKADDLIYNYLAGHVVSPMRFIVGKPNRPRVVCNWEQTLY